MWSLHLAAPWLELRFPRPVTTLGWTPRHGGRSETRSILWREVRNEDLSETFEVDPWLAKETAAQGCPEAPCFLTSARIADFGEGAAQAEGAEARALATAGLGNAERIGSRRGPDEAFGTLNLALVVNRPLSLPAALEALSLMAEARTAAMYDHAPRLWGPAMTGTGTDCLCLAWEPDRGTARIPERFAGKHTALGEVVGRAAYQAFSRAIGRWQPPQ